MCKYLEDLIDLFDLNNLLIKQDWETQGHVLYVPVTNV